MKKKRKRKEKKKNINTCNGIFCTTNQKNIFEHKWGKVNKKKKKEKSYSLPGINSASFPWVLTGSISTAGENVPS